MTHSDAVKLACVIISQYGGLALTQTVGLFTDERGHKRRLGVPGTSDILAIMPGGKTLAVEIKTGRAVQSRVQRGFESAIAARGADFVLARFIDAASGDAALREAISGLGYSSRIDIHAPQLPIPG